MTHSHYMNDEQTNTTNTQGAPVATNDTSSEQPSSLYDKTEAIVQRQEAANKKTEELLARQETLHANQRLAGTTGGAVEPVPEAKLTNTEYADKLMKGEVDPLGEDGISINA